VRRISDIAADFKRNIAAASPLSLRRTIADIYPIRIGIMKGVGDWSRFGGAAAFGGDCRSRGGIAKGCGIHRLRQAQSNAYRKP
jgi:hypothetical protein